MDESVDWSGILTCVHGILPIVYKEWYYEVTGRKPPVAAVAEMFGVVPDAVPIADDADTMPDLVGPGDDDAHGDDPAEPNAEEPDGADPINAASGCTKHREQDRSVGLRFTSYPSLGVTSIAMGLVMTCVWAFMYSSLDIGASAWGSKAIHQSCGGHAAGISRYYCCTLHA